MREILINSSVNRYRKLRLSNAYLTLFILLACFPIVSPQASEYPPIPKPRPLDIFFDSTIPASTKALKLSVRSQRSYKKALFFAEHGNWAKLRQIQRVPTNQALEKVITWLSLRHPRSKADFKTLAKFLDGNLLWPDRALMKRRAELLLNNKVPLTTRLDWLGKHPARSTVGRLKHINALVQANRTEQLGDVVRNTWQKSSFTYKEQRKFYQKYKSFLSDKAHWQRLDRLLWLGWTNSARNMLHLVSPGHRFLADARIKLRNMSGGVDNAIKRVPKEFRNNSGLIYERLRWRHRKGFIDKAQEFLWDAPNNQDFPALWWPERSRQIQHALSNRAFEDAYLLAASHIQREGRSFADAHWYAGWIALQFNNRAYEAIGYFSELYQRVNTPVSKARAAYWAGRSLEQSNNPCEAAEWYKLAAQHQTVFYGQLATKKIKLDPVKSELESIGKSNAPMRTNFKELINVVLQLKIMNKEKLVRKFLRTLAKNVSSGLEANRVSSLSTNLGHLDLAVYASRKAAQKGIILLNNGYPIIPIPKIGALEKALVLAVIRQESNFRTKAQSPSGALGLMQLMPRTARNISKTLNLGYTKSRLIRDPEFNLLLGTAYLKEQLNLFKGSYLLAIVAYNAGPKRVKRWLKLHGDPRDKGTDIIDWIERIPFSETRNYAQRVLENLYVYRKKLGIKQANRLLNWQPSRTVVPNNTIDASDSASSACAALDTAY